MTDVKSIKSTTPTGQVQWFKLIHPDQKFQKYQADLTLDDSEEVRKLIDQMEEMKKEMIEATKADLKSKGKPTNKVKESINSPIEAQVDSEGEETGKFVLKFRDGAEGKKKDGTIYKKAAPAIFNAKAKPIPKAEQETLKVPNGSSVKIAFEMRPYFVPSVGVGVSLKPKAAMLIKLEQLAQAGDFGFSPSEFAEQDDSDHEEFTSEAEEEQDADSDF